MNKSKKKKYFLFCCRESDILKLLESGQFSECGDIDIGNNEVNSESLYFSHKEN